MDLNHLLLSLKESHENLSLLEGKQRDIIQLEMNALISFVQKIFPFATKKIINGEQALLIYVFPIGEKDVISHEAYLTQTGDITYQVFDEVRYKGFRPEATVKNGYVQMPLSEFLKFQPLQSIIDFFFERPDVLNEYAYDLSKQNDERESFLNRFTPLL